jgi:hypothetical protein
VLTITTCWGVVDVILAAQHCSPALVSNFKATTMGVADFIDPKKNEDLFVRMMQHIPPPHGLVRCIALRPFPISDIASLLIRTVS